MKCSPPSLRTTDPEIVKTPEKLSFVNRAPRLVVVKTPFDSVIEEPEGGAHRSVDLTALAIRKVIEQDLKEIDQLDPADMREQRIEKYMAMGFTGNGPDVIGGGG